MTTLLKWLEHYEPAWLIILLTLEFLVSLYSAVILTIEYNYDREWNERKKERRKRQFKYENMNIGEGK